MKNTIIGIIIATAFWFVMFATFTEFTSNIHYNHFWPVMSIATISLTLFTIINTKKNFKALFEFKWKYLWIGIIHAILLYGLSRLGVWIFTELFDWAAPQIRAIYQTRTQAPKIVIAPLLFFLIAPAEEIFWRGYVQKNFMKKYGARIGTAIAIFFYTFVHIWAFNPMLLLAATVLGIHWSLIYTKFRSLVPGIISHAIWDVMIFVIFPVNV